MLHFLELTPKLQDKYNGGRTTMDIIKYANFCLYRYIVPAQDDGSINTTIIDFDTSISFDDFDYIKDFKDINRAGLFLYMQDYGLDIFNVHNTRQTEDFKYTCNQIASHLAVRKNVTPCVVFCNTLSEKLIDLNKDEEQLESQKNNENEFLKEEIIQEGLDRKVGCITIQQAGNNSNGNKQTTDGF